MTGHVRKALFALGLGSAVQRVALLAATIVLGSQLGPGGLGRYLTATAIGNLLAALVGAGVRSVCAREAARDPALASGWLRAATRMRATLTVAALAVVLPLLGAFADEPTYLLLGALLALPLAWDQKNLLDAVGRTGSEVAMELAVALLHLVGTLALLVAGVRNLDALVAVQVVARCGYALAAERTLRALPGGKTMPRSGALLRLAALPSLTQFAAGAIQNGDIWLVRWCGGDAAAGLYGVAQRLAGAAGLPGTQLLRLLQPHTDRAAAVGDGRATALRALRATAYAVVPIAIGGMVVAEPLCALFGAEFASAAPALIAMLAAFTALQFGWQFAQVLFAHGCTTAWALAQWSGAVAQAVAIVAATPTLGALGAGMAALLGNAVFCAIAHAGMPATVRPPLTVAVAPSLLVAAATALPALGAAPLGMVAQLAAGGIGFAASLYLLELRRTWRRLGAGLQGASGFGH